MDFLIKQVKIYIVAFFFIITQVSFADTHDEANKNYQDPNAISYKKRCNLSLFKYIAEFDIFGGALTGNYSGNTWAAGARALFPVNEVFVLGGEYVYSTLFVDNGSEFGLIKKTNAQQMLDAQLAVNFPILFGIGNSQIPMTLFLTLGTGAVNINKSWQWLGVIGGGLKIPTPLNWLAIRVDIESYLHNTPTIKGNKFGTDFTVFLGLAGLVPK